MVEVRLLTIFQPKEPVYSFFLKIWNCYHCFFHYFLPIFQISKKPAFFNLKNKQNNTKANNFNRKSLPPNNWWQFKNCAFCASYQRAIQKKVHFHSQPSKYYWPSIVWELLKVVNGDCIFRKIINKELTFF